MRFAVFSDIHGNLEALEAFIMDVNDRSIDSYFCLGDVVGYGASPGACLERLGSLPGLKLLMGNHDAAAIWQTSPYQMSSSASKAILWTMEQLSESQSSSIAALKNTVAVDDMLFCHANPYSPGNWRYVTTWMSAMRTFWASDAKITFIGHTHRPEVITRGKGLGIKFSSPPAEGSLATLEASRYIINCGSVGQPRDGIPNGSYVIYDTERQQVEFMRFEYDIESAARRIEAAGLPIYLAERLFKGR